METLLVALIAYAVQTLTLKFALNAMWDLRQIVTQFSLAQVRVGFAVIFACPATMVVFWIATRMANQRFADYLALSWPTSHELVIALALTAALLLAQSLAWPILNRWELTATDHSFSSSPDGLLIYLMGGCIAAPITEELAFRGFIFRGWSQSFLHPRGAIALTAVAWALLHTQYNWLGQASVFASRLLLGYIRWRSNSTWLTVMMHSGVNIIMFLRGGVYV
ncbi:CPBP family intramembrane metalloprotease [Bradyrhizobium arachidis]|uniref:CPBP family intramembrane glutamic endopeptidase n=1 Tax=Bradyrhizobium arachidis TaxID=858423 RepID=UPI0021616F11|nr:CPBP family intramembrane glutamic endopeptidase [Bradyrhizobium arachidis]UVO39921.1 CPBP family intramembrane metalloprotease [Bradyrhizobium arachidis]